MGEIEPVPSAWIEFSQCECGTNRDTTPDFQSHLGGIDLQAAQDGAVEVGLALGALVDADEPGREVPPISEADKVSRKRSPSS